jgi:hypothetical protein
LGGPGFVLEIHENTIFTGETSLFNCGARSLSMWEGLEKID